VRAVPELEVTREKAKEAARKPAAFGPDLDLGAYTSEAEELDGVGALRDLPPEVKEKASGTGIDAEEAARSGSFFQMNNSVLFASSRKAGLEVMSTTEALKRYDWLKDYWWRALTVDADKYTAKAELELHHGYFIRALPGARVSIPVQACLYLNREMFSQNVHNIILAEEGSELHIITGCTSGRGVKSGIHIGISEFYVQRGARITFSMIHSWSEDIAVRPRSGAIVEEGGVFLSNYICMKPVRTLQMYPVARCVGKGATARFNSILLAREGSSMDVGSRVVLSAPECRAEVIARAITTGGDIVSRGHLVGEAPGVKAHLECRGLILKENGRIHAVPELEGKVPDIDMSHEAAVGKIAEEEILYLMARGLTAEEATSAIVRGFLDIDIKGLPEKLKEEIDQAVSRSEKAERLF
jgi:Fe-S cluster assembly scaffold protein SufB